MYGLLTGQDAPLTHYTQFNADRLLFMVRAALSFTPLWNGLAASAKKICFPCRLTLHHLTSPDRRAGRMLTWQG